MNYVDFDHIKPGWGRIYQGGWIDEDRRFDHEIERPYGIISMAWDTNHPQSKTADLREDARFLFRKSIDDGLSGVLRNDELINIVMLATAYLSQNVALYIHCVAGRSRSSYIHAAIRCHILGWTGKEAFDYIGKMKPDIYGDHGLQQCFVDHVCDMFPEFVQQN